MPRLIIETGSGVREIRVDAGSVTLGRSSDCSVPISDRQLSREHCVIEIAPDGTARIRDLGSRNGTLVNGRRVADARLEPGDRIQIGSTVVWYERRRGATERRRASSGRLAGLPPDFSSWAAAAVPWGAIRTAAAGTLLVAGTVMLVVALLPRDSGQGPAGEGAYPPNGSFEAAAGVAPAGWAITVGSGSAISREAGGADGAFALRLDKSGGREDLFVEVAATEATAAPAGASAFARVRAQDFDGAVAIVLLWLDEAGRAWLESTGPPVKPAAEWTGISVRAARPAGAAQVRVALRACGGAGTILFDDVHFAAAQAAPPERMESDGWRVEAGEDGTIAILRGDDAVAAICAARIDAGRGGRAPWFMTETRVRAEAARMILEGKVFDPSDGSFVPFRREVRNHEGELLVALDLDPAVARRWRSVVEFLAAPGATAPAYSGGHAVTFYPERSGTIYMELGARASVVVEPRASGGAVRLEWPAGSEAPRPAVLARWTSSSAGRMRRLAEAREQAERARREDRPGALADALEAWAALETDPQRRAALEAELAGIRDREGRDYRRVRARVMRAAWTGRAADAQAAESDVQAHARRYDGEAFRAHVEDLYARLDRVREQAGMARISRLAPVVDAAREAAARGARAFARRILRAALAFYPDDPAVPDARALLEEVGP